jgi:hypothetical protein
MVPPGRVAAFLLAHRRARYVLHNAGVQFWLVDRHLESQVDQSARQVWWDAVEQNRVSDTMLLDQLIKLAKEDAEPRERNLSEIARCYTPIEIPSTSPAGGNHGQPQEADRDELALRDSWIILAAYRRMLLDTQRLTVQYGGGDIRQGAVARYGWLTEAVQVKAAIALARITQNGMRLDLDRVRATRSLLRRRLDAAVAKLRELSPQLFTMFEGQATGHQSLQRTASGTPVLQEHVLQAELKKVVEDLRLQTVEKITIPTRKDGSLSTSQEDWSRYADRHPFLVAWLELKNADKHRQFLGALQESPVHAAYRCLVRTGRTACSGPNLQQVPRDGLIRHAFVPSPGHYFVSIDFSCIDLRTLAAVCLHKYGRSVLADILRQGIDPHCHTAAMVLGISLEELCRWKQDGTVAERRDLAGGPQSVTYAQKYKEMRNAAKAINFGVPAGLGAATLVKYSGHRFGVHLTLAQAQQLRDTLTKVIYPELELYLAEDELVLLAQNLGTPEHKLREALASLSMPDTSILRGIRDVVAGQQSSFRGEPISQEDHDRIWRAVARLCTDPGLKPLLAGGRGSEGLARRLFGRDVATLTGRIRGGVDYGASRNTPFQGLAADGAKLALWRLLREGSRVLLFMHDEVVLEVPDEGGFVSKAVVDRNVQIMCEAMASVLEGDIPVVCEATVSTCWSKDAELIAQDGRVLPWSPGLEWHA